MTGPGPGRGPGCGSGVTKATRTEVMPLALKIPSSTLTTATVYSPFCLSPGKRAAVTGFASMLVTLPTITQSTAGRRWAPAGGSMTAMPDAVDASASRPVRPATVLRRMQLLLGICPSPGLTRARRTVLWVIRSRNVAGDRTTFGSHPRTVVSWLLPLTTFGNANQTTKVCSRIGPRSLRAFFLAEPADAYVGPARPVSTMLMNVMTFRRSFLDVRGSRFSHAGGHRRGRFGSKTADIPPVFVTRRGRRQRNSLSANCLWLRTTCHEVLANRRRRRPATHPNRSDSGGICGFLLAHTLRFGKLLGL